MTPRTRHRRLALTAAALTAAAALTSCGTDTADQPASDPDTTTKTTEKTDTPATPAGPHPTHKPRTAAAAHGTDVDTLILASILEMRHVETGHYPDRAPDAANAGLSPGNTVTGYTPTKTSYTFCVVHTDTGAWAHYDSVSAGITGAGLDSAACTPN